MSINPTLRANIIAFTFCMMLANICLAQKLSQRVPSSLFTNLYQVNDSIYRSEQPIPAGFKELSLRKIKSILNLRNDFTDLDALKESNFSLFAVPMDPNDITDFVIIQALRIIKTAPKPLLIHCEAGADRTGVVIAMYRILFQNYSREEAIKEMTKGGFNFHDRFDNIPRYVQKVDTTNLRKLLLTPAYSIALVSLDLQFNKGIEISGLAIKGDQVILAEEKCKRLLSIKTSDLGRQNVTGMAILLNRGLFTEVNPQIEAISFYKNRLLMTDEAAGKIYLMTMDNRESMEVRSKFDFTADIEKMGIEGIAVNPDAGICFVLKERDISYRSEIRQFKIREDDTGFWFDLIKIVSIQHPVFNNDPNFNWRYSDICYDQKTGMLVCLKSYYYGRGSERNKYIIDFLDTNPNTGFLQDGIIQPYNMLYSIDISAAVNGYANVYNTNLEGIGVNGWDIYLVSDNKESSSSQCNDPGDGKTLFLIIKSALANMQH